MVRSLYGDVVYAKSVCDRIVSEGLLSRSFAVYLTLSQRYDVSKEVNTIFVYHTDGSIQLCQITCYNAYDFNNVTAVRLRSNRSQRVARVWQHLTRYLPARVSTSPS